MVIAHLARQRVQNNLVNPVTAGTWAARRHPAYALIEEVVEESAAGLPLPPWHRKA